MYSLHKTIFRNKILLFTFLIFLQCNTTGGFPLGPSLYAGTHVEAVHKRATLADQDYNAENVYGRGLLIGSYCQAVSFLLGFLTLRNVDPKSQFAGIILAFQLLYRWWTRLLSHSITIPELWIGLAQLLLFTTSGAMPVFLSFSYARRHWKTTGGKELLRKEVIRGEGLNFVLAFTFLAWVNATNFTFAFTFIFKLAPETFLTSNPVWMWTTCQAESGFFKSVMFIQAGATFILKAVPYAVYFWAWLHYLRDFDMASFLQALVKPGNIKKSRRNRIYQQNNCFLNRLDRIQELDDAKRRHPNCTHRLLTRLWAFPKWIFSAFLVLAMAAYIAILITSIERTIQEAGLKPADDLLDPSQLLPLVTGILALASALANFLDNRLLLKTPVRFEQSLRGDIVIYTKDGIGLPQKQIAQFIWNATG